MLKFLARLFGIVKTDIDSIISDIVQKVENLHVVAEAHIAEAKVQAALRDEAQKAADFAEKEYARAKAIAERLTALVNG